MPLAALFVVQDWTRIGVSPVGHSFNAARGFVCGARYDVKGNMYTFSGFNAARGFVCGASLLLRDLRHSLHCFNAARGFVCGASTSLTALVSLVSNGSFGKSPDV